MSVGTEIQSAAVYCGSSDKCEERYLAEAERVGRVLAEAGIRIVYGGGSDGLMGRVADAGMRAGGGVTGIIPRFMVEVEWAHSGLNDLRIVKDMHARKQLILSESDAVVALPGGCGTLEELLEAITWKQLGLFAGPIVIVNHEGFYTPVLEMLERCIQGKFMNPDHEDIWCVAASADEILAAFKESSPGIQDALASAPER
jgi:uncharacterized protein (TIGR00730 family)